MYYFEYAVCEQDGSCHKYEQDYAPVFLAFSSPTVSILDSEIDWVHDVGPILSQYAQTAPTMKKILDMSKYHEVVRPRNRELLKISLTRNIEDPAYMPATRDLSPSRRDMIMKWLNQDEPKYDRNNEAIPLPHPEEETVYSTQQEGPDFYDPERCKVDVSLSPEDPTELTTSYSQLFLKEHHELDEHERSTGRPLLGLLKSDIFKCTRPNLEKQLQTAIRLEFATIPPYLTALYSIKDGYNRQIYNSLRSVVMEEMLHMTQVANVLIAMNAKPNFDYVDMVPSYPSVLPGDVIPGLEVTIRKFSLEHLRDVFMGIEFPTLTDVAGQMGTSLFTIGRFYLEIRLCIEHLGEGLFNGTSNQQVHWPWKNDDLVVVTDVDSAKRGIEMIVEQGEGAGMHDPTQADDSDKLAHFFKFEEISCGNKLKLDNKSSNTYHYQGPIIHYNPDGVWPMRDNPKASNTPPDSNCYTERKAFHGVFRNLLRQLQKIFNGYNSEEEVQVAVELMESIQIHAKKTMWTKFKPNVLDEETCGPVWDYEWPD